MRKLLIIAMVFCAVSLMAQETEEKKIPVNETTGQAEFSGVEEVKGATAGQLYSRSLLWIHEFYPNPYGVIQAKDSLSGKIEGKAQFRLENIDKKGNISPGAFVAYSFTLEFKEGRYRYVIDRIHAKQSSYFDISRWENPDETNYDAEKWASYVDQTLSYFEDMINQMNEALARKEEVKSKDW